MLKDKELSVTEVIYFFFNKCVGKSEQEIARLMKRSKTAIHNSIIREKDSNKVKQNEKKKEFDRMV